MRKRDFVTVIFSTHSLHPDVAAMLSSQGDLRYASALDHGTLEKESRGAAIIIVRAPLPETLFHEAPKLQAAVRHGAGLDMIPVEAATEAGVLVANVPGANASTVAEHVFFAALALLRRYREMDADLRSSGWTAGREHSNRGNDLSGKTIGIIGMGNVGREVFRIAYHGFQLPVIAATRSPDRLPEEVRPVLVDQLVEDSDIIVLCCPLTPETAGLINEERLARMKRAAILVNVSRGPVVDEVALLKALQEGRLGGAALDVFATQPLPADHPFFDLRNVLITPHMAGITEESMFRMGSGAADEAIRVLKGGLPANLCNPEAVSRYRERFPEVPET